MSGVTDDVAASEVLSYGRKRAMIMEAVDHDPNCVLANILAAHISCSSDPSRVPSLLHAANYNIEYATPYEKAVFEAINCLISPNRNDDVAFELHSKRSVPNGKLMRRAGASSSTSNSTSVKRGSEKRTSTMYVLREGRKNTNVKEKSTYVKRADRQSSEKCLSSSTVMTVERKKRKRSKKLSEQLQQKGVDIIQTEGGKCSNPSKPGVLGLIENVI
ncbi:hypothetical protein L2E82_18698 [Cichorium intybus]|uniref:Uncharacterized protein n=1 Tax=Cichorium intybus TaxID=13427 RepID=A0ACB9FC37_CICIN|nr:hypothetical protein L2E82_18698 [Cichorium intybus]